VVRRSPPGARAPTADLPDAPKSSPPEARATVADLPDAPKPPRAGASPAAPWPGGRPEPTRAATLAAFRNALPAGAAPLAPSPFGAAGAAPAIAPVLAVSRWPSPPRAARPTLARVETDTNAEPAQIASGRQGSASTEPPDLDALADHVIERLRHELRDGRERLGYLLDDLR
jgi:translation initiation factor IF-2